MFPAGEQIGSRTKRFIISMLRSAVLLRYTTEILQLYAEQKHGGRPMIFHEYMVSQYASPYNFFGTVFYYSRGIGMLVTKQTL